MNREFPSIAMLSLHVPRKYIAAKYLQYDNGLKLCCGSHNHCEMLHLTPEAFIG